MPRPPRVSRTPTEWLELAMKEPLIRELMGAGDELRLLTVQRERAMKRAKRAEEARAALAREWAAQAQVTAALIKRVVEETERSTPDIAEILGINQVWVERVRNGTWSSAKTPGQGPKLLRPPTHLPANEETYTEPKPKRKGN